ncbi:hypothetical protein C1T21_03730 [Paenibacillus sp. F4]|nr:hypothetical protein C1T21_03730 [Paenibacillus sp. F4]
MSLYLKFFELSFREKYAYKFNFFTSMLAGFIMIFIQISVWIALFKESSAGSAATLGQMIIYVLISSFIFNITRSEAGTKIGEKIDKGTIITDFTKPIHFRNYMFAEDAGNNMFQVLFIFFPSFLFFSFFYRLQISITPLNFMLFIVSLVFAVLISFFIKFIIGLFAFWLETSWYFPFIVGAIFELFSGSTIPIWYYPDWLVQICSYLPLRFIFFEPISIFLGKYTLTQTLLLLLTQLFWVCILFCIERFVWNKVQKRVIVHGG